MAVFYQKRAKVILGEQFNIRPKQHCAALGQVDGKVQGIGQQRLLRFQAGHHHHIKRKRNDDGENYKAKAFEQPKNQQFKPIAADGCA